MMQNDWAGAEFRGATSLDVRVRGNLADLCQRLAADPTSAFSAAAGSSGRQVFQRLSSGSGKRSPGDVADTWDQDPESGIAAVELLSGHVKETARRCQAYPLVLVAQDTTELYFPHSPIPMQRGGLGPTSVEPNKRGLFAHAALALSPAGLPLGVLHIEFWSRDPTEHGKRVTRRSRATVAKESQKWLSGVQAIEAALPAEQPVLVVQDREGDVFALLAQSRRPNTWLLIRACQNRKVKCVTAEGKTVTDHLFHVAKAGTVLGELTVQAPRQRDQEEETIRLELQASQMDVQPPINLPAAERRRLGTATVWVIRAREINPPPGNPAIEWVLVTTLPVRTAAEAAQIVGYYACRWRIERLHYVLKSGMQVEASQHASRATLERVLGLYYLTSWWLLRLTYLGRLTPELPVQGILTGAEIRILVHSRRKPVNTIADAVMAIGILGGYLPYRRALPPGVKVLWRGYQRLEAAVLGYHARGKA